MPADAIVIPVSALSPEERRRLSEAVRQGEEVQRQLRAADSGILLADRMPAPAGRA